MATVAPSVNYTEASRKFQEDLLNLEPGTLNGGLYAFKAGYHNKRQNLPTTDYSVKAAIDRLGPADKSAAHDWTFPTAQAGNFDLITKYTRRVEAAFWARDPRLKGWREVLGCINGQAIGFDFDSWNTRRPDSTHEWHMHFSEHRAHTESVPNKQAMLSIVSDATLTEEGVDLSSMVVRQANGSIYLVYTTPWGTAYQSIASITVAEAWRQALKPGTYINIGDTPIWQFGMAAADVPRPGSGGDGDGATPEEVEEIVDRQLDQAFSGGADNDS